MIFWRNDNTNTFDPDDVGQLRILAPLVHLESAKNGDAEPVGVFLALMLDYLEQHVNLPKSLNRLLLQEYSINDMTADIRFVINGMEGKIVDTITGGGFRIFIDFSEGYKSEISLYYHRLVCANGMIRKTESCGLFHAFSLEEWTSQVEKSLPLIMSGIPVGLDTFYRSAQVRLGFLIPMLPVALDYLEVAEPYRGMILDSFNKEPGDTLWHFINAFSRAANLVMLAHGISEVEAARKRLQLQKASVSICENVIENFTQGKSIFEFAEIIKKGIEI